MGLFRSSKKSSRENTVQDCERMVERFLKKVKLNPKEQRLSQGEGLGWWISRGSAVIYIYLNENGHSPTIRIIAPILYLPDDHILPFYRRCLELNTELINCAVGVVDDKVALVNERPIAGLDQAELESVLHYLSGVADEIDDKLAEEFGARLYANAYRGA